MECIYVHKTNLEEAHKLLKENLAEIEGGSGIETTIREVSDEECAGTEYIPAVVRAIEFPDDDGDVDYEEYEDIRDSIERRYGLCLGD